MFIPWQTHEGINVSMYSLFEVIFLLENGASFVLTEKSNLLEEYLESARSLGRRNDNPDVYQFGCNSNTIRLQRSIAINTKIQVNHIIRKREHPGHL